MLQRLFGRLFGRRAPAAVAAPPPPPSAQMTALFDALQRLDLLERPDQLPRITPPAEGFPPNCEWLAMPPSPIADAFHITIILDAEHDRFVLLRQGGFAGVWEHYQGAVQDTLRRAAQHDRE